MAVTIPIARFKSLQIAATYGTAIVVTALSNAADASATAAAHGLVVGDYIEVTSGWPALDGKIVRVKTAPSTGVFTMETIDTTDTSVYPAGAGIGSVKKILTWATIPNPKDINVTGGDPKTLEVNYADVDNSILVIVGKNPIQMSIPFRNDVTTAGYAALKAADSVGTPKAFKAVRKDGNIHLYNGSVSLAAPNFQVGQDITNTATVLLVASSVQYSS